MARKETLEGELSLIAEARDQPRSAESLALLRRMLDGKRNFSVAAAAKLVGEAGLVELTERLPAAFERFVERGPDVDPGCHAKLAVAIALAKLDYGDADFFARGIRLVQRDPVWGGSVDSAVGVRGQCAMALAQFHDPRVLPSLARLLVDFEWVARADAARALGATGRLEAEAVLRLKALSGDPEPQVMIEVFAALLALSPKPSLDFVGGFLDGAHEQPAVTAGHTVVAGGEVGGPVCTACGGQQRDGAATQEAAAMALGQSRVDGAFPLLRDFAGRAQGAALRVALLALSMLRSEAALAHLLGLVADAPPTTAEFAVAALAVHRYDEALGERVRVAVQQKKRLLKIFREAFAGDEESQSAK